ncbi:MAG: response regulator [Desulfobacteraceae bacterium]|nr:response regulator [Desulfobacteraceae bacterium]
MIGKKKYIQAIVRDITERKYAEQKLAETREKLLKSEKLKAIGTLAGGIAHDFNNTLSVTLGNINLAQMVSSNAEVIQFLEDAEKSVVQAKELASKFIVFSDGGIIVKHKIEIRSFLMKTLQSISASQNLEYQLQFKDMPRHIEADPHQLKEVLKNVVVNAFEAMDGMDTVMIQCKKYKSRPDCIIISVEDKGRGIREEDIDHIFEPYYSTKPKGKDKGTGLGLSVAHSIVKNHRGNILIHTSSEKGTRIDIILPVSQTRGIKPAKAAEQVKDKKQKAPETKNSMVLLMDDDDIVLQVTSKILKRIGFEPVTATKGEEAVMIYEEHYAAGKTIDIAILDLEIKYGLGGVKTMQQLLAINPNIKGIISSGYSSDNVMKNFGEFGFTLALAKPYNLDILKEALEQLQ